MEKLLEQNVIPFAQKDKSMLFRMILHADDDTLQMLDEAKLGLTEVFEQLSADNKGAGAVEGKVCGARPGPDVTPPPKKALPWGSLCCLRQWRSSRKSNFKSGKNCKI